MITIYKSNEFASWFSSLKDRQARARILARLDRVTLGNFGDTKTVHGNISELRIDYGPGYRLYYIRQGKIIVVLLAGGDKRTQAQDIARSIKVAQDWSSS